MTAQISDIVCYRNRDFCIAGIKGDGLFDPSEHGLRPFPFSTACWRGYHCTYVVSDGWLRLRTVNIGLIEEDQAAADRGEGPKLFSRVPGRYTIHGPMRNLKTGEIIEEWLSSDYRYDDLDEVIPFTGGLLVGADFIDEMYVHMGFHPAFKFREVFELFFENGKLVKAEDRSKAMAEYRNRIKNRPLEPPRSANHREIEEWIESTFRLDYE